LSGIQCKGTKRDGSACTLLAWDGSEWCWAHHPQTAAKRVENGRVGGRKRPKEIQQIKRDIRQLIADVKEERIDKGRASVAFQGYGVLKGMIEVERRVKETEDLAERITELERVASSASGASARRGGVRGW